MCVIYIGPTAHSSHSFALNASQLAKWKSTIHTCPCHKMYRVEAVGQSITSYTYKIMIFVNI